MKACRSSILDYELNRNEFFKDECNKICPKECKTISYIVSISERSMIRSSSKLIRIYIYFADFKYQHISEIAKMNIFDLIGNVGGTLLCIYWISVTYYCRSI